jgi:medium-chain acyl-[acyl-carrier-protein] hydrolase
VSVNKWFPGLKRRPGARLQLFCLPFAGGGASAFRGWGELLPPWTEVWPLEYPGHETRFREASCDNASELTAAISAELATVIDRPFALFGHSMGALLAFEIARSLRRHSGVRPVALFASAHGDPRLRPLLPPVKDLPEAQCRAEMRRYGGTSSEVLANDELMEFLSPLLRDDMGICETYVYSTEAKLNVPIIAFGGADDPTVPWHRLLGWSEHTEAASRAFVMPGEHFFLRTAAPLICKAITQQLEHGETPNRIMPPTAGEVHLWRVNVEMPDEDVARLRPLLSPDELRHADAYLRDADRARYTVTRSALRILLGRYGNAPAERIELSYSSHGKPRCERLLPLEFNVAHSGSFALIAIARDQAVGVDIERIRDGLDLLGIGKLVFTEPELSALAQRPPDQQTDAFFDLWTRKEAYLKCSGEGFLGSPEKVHVGLPPTSDSVRSLGGQRGSLGEIRLVQSFRPAADYAAALAVEKGWEQVNFRNWQIDSAS